MEPVAAAGNHPGEREADAGDRRGVKLQHDPWDPQADHQLHDGPHGERAGHGDLHAGPDDDDRRESAPQRIAGVEDRRPVGGHNLVHDLIGGYQVLKKWLSYRERGILGRALMPHEVQYFTEIARRIAAILTTAR